MMESPPATPLEMSQAQFALQFLVVVFDAPSQLDDVDESRERPVLGQGREPVFGRLRPALRPFDDETICRAADRRGRLSPSSRVSGACTAETSARRSQAARLPRPDRTPPIPSGAKGSKTSLCAHPEGLPSSSCNPLQRGRGYRTDRALQIVRYLNRTYGLLLYRKRFFLDSGA